MQPDRITVMDTEPKYRSLKKDEIIIDGDEVFFFERNYWLRLCSTGKKHDPKKFDRRRLIPQPKTITISRELAERYMDCNADREWYYEFNQHLREILNPFTPEPNILYTQDIKTPAPDKTVLLWSTALKLWTPIQGLSLPQGQWWMLMPSPPEPQCSDVKECK
jgi:hypothetical protein